MTNMKKTYIWALALLASTAACSSSKAVQETVKNTTEETEAPVNLVGHNDSLSYAAGIAVTQGLDTYLAQMGIDSAHVKDFIQGFRVATEKANDPAMKAYVAGTQIAQQVQRQIIPGIANDLQDTPDTLDRNLFLRGFVAALQHDSTLYTESAAQKFYQERMAANKKAKEEKLYGENRRAGEAFLEQNKLNDSVKVTPSGLQYKVLVQGDGDIPQRSDRVKVKYEGKLVDGTVFDSSYKRTPQTSTFRADQVIKGWTEALTMMPVGSKWMLYIPQELGYGERQAGKITPFSALIFEVELVEIEGKKTNEAAKKAEPAAKKVVKKAAKKAKKRK